MTWTPNRKQKIIYNARQRYIHALGDPRTGKTEGFFYRIRRELLQQRGIKILITRDTGTSLSATTYKHLREKYIITDDMILDEKSKPFTWVKLLTGSELFFIPYDEMDTSKAGGAEYGIILMDEAQRFKRKQWEYFDTRLSQQWGEAIAEDGRKYQNRIVYNGLWSTANPKGRGYLWQIYVREHPLAYFHHYDKERDCVVGDDPEYLGVKFFLEDNEANLKPEYIRAMRGKADHIRRKFLGAEEEAEGGLVYPEFNRGIHVIDTKMKGITPAPHWRIIGGMDFGFATPTVFLLGAVTEEGFLIIFREYREDHKSIPSNIDGILGICKPMPERALIDSSTGIEDGKSPRTVYDQFRVKESGEIGLGFLGLAKRSHVMFRVSRIRGLLEPNPQKRFHPITGEERKEGWPTLMFVDVCEGTIIEHEEWEMEESTTEKKNEPDKPKMKDDHGCDATGYLAQLYFGDGSPENEQTESIREADPSTRLQKIIKKDIDTALAERDRKHDIPRASGAVF